MITKTNSNNSIKGNLYKEHEITNKVNNNNSMKLDNDDKYDSHDDNSNKSNEGEYSLSDNSSHNIINNDEPMDSPL